MFCLLYVLFFCHSTIDQINDNPRQQGQEAHERHPHHRLVVGDESVHEILMYQIDNTPDDQNAEDDRRDGIAKRLVTAFHVGILPPVDEHAEHREQGAEREQDACVFGDHLERVGDDEQEADHILEADGGHGNAFFVFMR